MSTHSPPTGSSNYRERLWPAPWVWASMVLLGLSCGLVAAPFSSTAAEICAATATIALVAALLAWTPQVAVHDAQLRAGRARIPVRLLGAVTVLDADALRHAHGPGLDVRAYLCIRGWIPTGLRVDLADPQDPTPYWLVSSRRPERLSAALDAARRTVA